MHPSAGFVLRLTWLATIALTAPAVGPGRLWAQDAAQRPAQKSMPAARVPVRAAAPGAASEPASRAAKSLSQRVFDAPWVLFPTRLAVVIVLGAVAALFLAGSLWSTVRLAHLLRHMHWKEPPRRLKRGELGAAGASLAFEFEERLNVKREEDEERDRQIAWLRTTVLRLTADHNRTAAALKMITEPGETDRPHGEADDAG